MTCVLRNSGELLKEFGVHRKNFLITVRKKYEGLEKNEKIKASKK